MIVRLPSAARDLAGACLEPAALVVLDFLGDPEPERAGVEVVALGSGCRAWTSGCLGGDSAAGAAVFEG